MKKIVEDMPTREYHANKAISRSGLMEIARSPQHYWWKYLSGKALPDDTTALRIGTAFHCLLLEPKRFNDTALVWSGKPRNTKEGKDEYAIAESQANGRVLIKQDEFNQLQDMAASILAQPAARLIIAEHGKVETSFFWKDKDYGVNVKARPDYWRDDGIVVDLKTTNDASSDAFSKSIVNYGYDVQAYMQMEAIEQCTGKRPDAFVFLVVEKDPPYAVAFYQADNDMLRCGEKRYKSLIAKYAECLESGKWPGYGALVRPIGVPSWFVTRVESEE